MWVWTNGKPQPGLSVHNLSCFSVCSFLSLGVTQDFSGVRVLWSIDKLVFLDSYYSERDGDVRAVFLVLSLYVESPVSVLQGVLTSIACLRVNKDQKTSPPLGVSNRLVLILHFLHVLSMWKCLCLVNSKITKIPNSGTRVNHLVYSFEIRSVPFVDRWELLCLKAPSLLHTEKQLWEVSIP